jgi:hypothetical protein
VVPGSALSEYSDPSQPAPVPVWSPGIVHFQMQASPMITTTTTRLMTVSWNMAYGKNGFPRLWTSRL